MIIEVDITKYNINYELQYVQFMVGLLRPYIEFECFDTEEKTTNLAGESVPKKGLKIFRKKEIKLGNKIICFRCCCFKISKQTLLRDWKLYHC